MTRRGSEWEWAKRRTPCGANRNGALPHPRERREADVLQSVKHEALILKAGQGNRSFGKRERGRRTTLSDMTMRLCSSAIFAIPSSSARVSTFPTGL